MTVHGAAGAPPLETTELHLDAAEYTTLWRRVVGGDKPLILASLDHGRTHAERDAIDAAAWRRLREAGHLDGRDAPVPGLVDVLGILACPDVEIDVREWTTGEPRGTLAAARGGLGVTACLDDGGGLRVAPAHAADLAGALLARIPDVAPLPGIPVTLPLTALQGEPGGGAAARDARLRRAGVPRPARERISSMWAEPPRRRLQFGVARRDRLGRRRRGPVVLNVVDTARGRVLVRPVGRELLIRPVDRSWLRRELLALLVAVPTR